MGGRFKGFKSAALIFVIWDGFAAAILLSARRLVELGLKAKGK